MGRRPGLVAEHSKETAIGEDVFRVLFKIQKTNLRGALRPPATRPQWCSAIGNVSESVSSREGEEPGIMERLMIVRRQSRIFKFEKPVCELADPVLQLIQLAEVLEKQSSPDFLLIFPGHRVVEIRKVLHCSMANWPIDDELKFPSPADSSRVPARELRTSSPSPSPSSGMGSRRGSKSRPRESSPGDPAPMRCRHVAAHQIPALPAGNRNAPSLLPGSCRARRRLSTARRGGEYESSPNQARRR